MNKDARISIRIVAAAVGLLGLCGIAACHSYHIEATVENRTGEAITLLEVDYPSASFGVDTLAPDGAVHHRIQTRDSGPVSVQYTAAHGHQVQVKGPTLYENQQGTLDIVLLPGGKVEFHPELQTRN
jgi:hypothetical protein